MTCRPNLRLNLRPNLALNRRPASARWLALAATVLTALGLQACQAQPPAGPLDEAALRARIRSAVAEARCSDDRQCLTLPIGEKPCGGPEQWLPYASNPASAAQLKAWAAALSSAAKRRNQSSGMAGTCQFTPDPGAVCVAGRCVAGAAAGGAAGGAASAR